MNANEFVKRYGWLLSKAFIDNWSDLSIHYGFDVLNLKRLVESHDLVESAIEWHGDIVAVKNYIENVDSGLKHGVYFKCAAKKTKDNNDKLKQAIADVESCTEVV